jgi:hypothetical protein
MSEPALGKKNFSKQISFLVTFGIYSAAYLISFHEIVFSEDYFPIRDSFLYHYKSFQLFSNSLALFGRPPEWIPPWGGWSAGMGFPVIFFFIPYKLIGYAGVVAQIDTLLLYKMSLTLGVLITGTAWKYGLESLGFSPSASILSGLCLVVGGTGMTVFHQDQVLATVFWYPFVMLALGRFMKGEISITSSLIFVGFLFSTHRPTLHLYTLVLCLIVGLIYFRDQIGSAAAQPFRRRHAISIIWCAFSLAPFFYLLYEVANYMSPIRIDQIISASTYQEYLAMNKEQQSSAPWIYFSSYIWPEVFAINTADRLVGQDDAANLFISRAGIFLAVVGAFLNWRKSWVVYVVRTFWTDRTLV